MEFHNLSLRKYNENFSSILLSISLFMLGFRSTIANSNLPDLFIYKSITIILWLLVLITIILNFYTKKELIICFVLLVLTFKIFSNTEDNAPFFNTLLIIAALHKDPRKLLTGHFYGILFAVLLTILAFFLGCIPDTISWGGSKSLGFANPNALPARLTTLVFLYVYIWYKKTKLRHFVFINFISFSVYSQTGSRSGLIIILGFTIFVFLSKRFCFFRFLLRKFCVIGAISIALIAILGIAFYSFVPIFQKLDEILTGRLSQPLYYFEKYKPKIFGNYMREFIVPNARPKQFALDNGYARCLLSWGILYFFLFFISYWKSIRIHANNKDFATVNVLLFILLYMLSEAVFCSININCFIILCVEVIFLNNCKIRWIK